MSQGKKNLGTDDMVKATETPTVIRCLKDKHSGMSSVPDAADVQERNKPVMGETSGAVTKTDSHCREGTSPERGSPKMAKAFVVDVKGRPCLPCHPVRARMLLRKGKAEVHSVVPFTIRLFREIEHPVGSFMVGIDDGAKEVGIAVVNEHTREVVFSGEMRLRQDVSRKILQRSQYRRARRSRKLRNRPARFDNRKRADGWIVPSIRQKKDSILRVVIDLRRRINIVSAVMEQGEFDTSSLVKGRQLYGKEYQAVEFEGRNFRAKVLWWDRYVCQRPGCGSVQRLQAHHIIPKSKGGTDTVSNGITLCEGCHDDLHKRVWQFAGKPRLFKYPAHLQIGKRYLVESLGKMGLQVETCLGWMTSGWRKVIGLSKSHCNDAIAMVCKSYIPAIVDRQYLILPRRRKVWEDNPTKTCVEKDGFRHWDLVKAKHRTRGIVIGCIRSLKKMAITLRTAWDDNFPVSYNKTKLMWRFDGIVYV